jgi:hypothetical protein
VIAYPDTSFLYAAGHRAFGVLHVATALRLEAKEFLTFNADRPAQARRRRRAKSQTVKANLSDCPPIFGPKFALSSLLYGVLAIKFDTPNSVWRTLPKSKSEGITLL